MKRLRALKQTVFECEKDAEKAVRALNKKLKWHMVQAQYQSIKKYAQRGRPAKGVAPVSVGWKIQGRIMAMIMVMGLSLLVYALAEREIRRKLATSNETIPDQKGKPTRKPTMRRLAQMFEGIDLLEIRVGGNLVERRVLNLSNQRVF